MDPIDEYILSLGVSSMPSGPASEVVASRPHRTPPATARRNRRLKWSQQAIASANAFYCDEAMRERDPLIFDSYMSSVSHSINVPFDSSSFEGVVAARASGQQDPQHTVMLSEVLMAAAVNDGPHAQGAIEDDEELDEDSEESGAVQQANLPWGHERAGGASGVQQAIGPPQATGPDREGLLRAMIERFISGADSAYFDYSTVDNDESLDYSREAEQDAQDRYFDGPGNDDNDDNDDGEAGPGGGSLVDGGAGANG